VDLKGKDSVPETVHHGFVTAEPTKDESWKPNSSDIIRIETDGIHKKDHVLPGQKTPEALSESIKLLKPHLLLRIIVNNKMDQALIFVRTKVDADNLEKFFKGVGNDRNGALENEYSCVVLHGDRSAGERKENLRKFKDGEVRFLICTDVAARGIDIKELPYVINYTLPDKPEDYIHRVGRVGRADRMGLAISIVGCAQEKVWYHQCPSRGKACNNTTLVENGGCALWYDEPLYWQEIQKRLNQEVGYLDKDYKLPAGGGHESGAGTVYGKVRQGSGQQVYEVHVEQLRDQVKELGLLEDIVQKKFWAMKAKWTKNNK